MSLWAVVRGLISSGSPVPGANPTFSIENWRLLYLLISYLTFATHIVIQKI
jgi:hypothetical protein